MFQFYIKEQQIIDNEVSIIGEDFKHMKQVVRLKEGDLFRVSNEAGNSFFCQLNRYTESEGVGILLEPAPTTELLGEIVLFQGLPKGDKMDLIVQKTVELGVTRIVPVAMKNCVVRLNEKKEQAKIKRWQAIAQAAAKQSKRSIVPRIEKVMSYNEALSYGEHLDHILVPYESQAGIKGSKKCMASVRAGQSVGVYIGPEGGFTLEEIQLVDPKDRISLGRRILRTETAAIATVALLMYQLEEDLD